VASGDQRAAHRGHKRAGLVRPTGRRATQVNGRTDR
jgi:hypothetical protein